MSGSTRGSSSARWSSSSRAVLAVLVLVLVLDVVALGGMKAMGLSLLPQEPAAPVVAGASPTPTPSGVTPAQTPAATVITSALSTSPAPTWRPTGTVTWAASTAFDRACPVNNASSGAALAGQRVFLVGGRAVTVAIRAYGAGQGMPAMRTVLSRVRQCTAQGADVGAAPTANLRVAAIAGWAKPAGSPTKVSTLMWRRGDVVASVTVAGGPTSLPALVLAFDPALLARLASSCADLHPVFTDAARSPYGDRAAYQGWQVPLPVQIPPIGPPSPPPGVFPVPLDQTATPLPSISIPVQPVPPLWPVALPTAVQSPIAPTPPGAEPTSTQVPIPTEDPVGPGCGWSFTGQIPPPFDAAAAQAAGDAATQSAREQLGASQQAWQQAALDFWSSQSLYDSIATQYVAYAAAVRTVAKAWDRITADREQYAQALTDYTTALATQADFLARRAAAQAAYDAALAACSSIPTPIPTPDPGTGVQTCPPAYPPILAEPVPTVPPSPAPPVVRGPGGVPLPTDAPPTTP